MIRTVSIMFLCAMVLFAGCTTSGKGPLPSHAPSSSVENPISDGEYGTDIQSSISGSKLDAITDIPSFGSRNTSVDERDDGLLKQANIITHHLITQSFNNSVVDDNPPSDWAINSFILTVPVMQEDDYMYKDLVEKSNLYEYPEKSVQQIAFDVFGVDNWILEGGDVEYDTSREIYTSSLAFGIGGFLSCENVSSTFSSDRTTIVSQFILMDNSGFGEGPAWREIGEYKMFFLIIQDDEREFIRFINMGKNKRYGRLSGR